MKYQQEQHTIRVTEYADGTFSVAIFRDDGEPFQPSYREYYFTREGALEDCRRYIGADNFAVAEIEDIRADG